MKYRLKDLNSNTEIELKTGENSVGRGSDCDITLPDHVLSRRHMTIKVGESGLSVLDMNSTNGTQVNYIVIREETPLKHGDVVSLGEKDFQVLFPGAGPATVLPKPKSNSAESYVAHESLGGRTALRQAFSLPPGWSVNDRSDFTSTHGEISEIAILKLLSESKILSSHCVGALVILEEGKKNRAVGLAPNKNHQWTLGRSEGCDIVIESDTISKLHAKFIRQGSDWVVVDNQSRNGLKLNRKKTDKSSLSHNDILQFGDVKCIFRVID